MIPVFDPLLFGDEAEYIRQTLADGFISGTSPTVRRFEERFSVATQARHAVAVCNGTAALHLALMALGVKPGDEVIIPDFTIISDALAIVMCGAVPVFVDVNRNDWCVDVSQIEARITPKTVGIIPVHIYGHGCDMDGLMALSKRRGLWVVEDAAQAHGGSWNGQVLGSFGQATCYSFYSNKLITTGEGGAVTTDDEEMARRMRELANLAFDPLPERRFIHTALSHNYRLSSLQAAMGLAQLSHWQELLDLRTRLRSMYQDVLLNVPGICLPKPDERCRSSFWASTLLLDGSVDIAVPTLQKRLFERQIDTRRFFYPLHRQPALLLHHGQAAETFTVSDDLFDRGLYLPSSSKLTWEQVQFIAKELNQCLTAA